MIDHIHFLIPDPNAFPSGGNIYNSQLITALESKGCSLTLSHEMEALKDLEASQILLVDTLFLEAFDPKISAIPCVLIVHHLSSMEPTSGAQPKLERRRLLSYDGFLSTSDFTENFLRENWQLDQFIITIPPVLESVDQITSKSLDTLTVLVVANLIPRKGILPFIQEWAKYCWPSNFQLRLIGDVTMDPAYAEDCQRFWMSLSAEKKNQIVFTGALAQGEVFRQYQTADVLVSAAAMETFGMALQEAASFSLPLLVLEGGYSGKHVANGNGAVFKSLGDLVLGLKEWTEEAPLRKAYSEAARKKVTPKISTWQTAADYLLQNLNQKISVPENAFDTTWLNTRFAFDEAARNSAVDLAARSFMQSIGEPSGAIRLLDIGAGTGANFLHFYEQLPFAQKWTFLDHDSRLLRASLDRIEEEATLKRYPFERKEAALLIHHPKGDILIQILCGSFEEITQLLNLQEIDLVMASAFFDLFTTMQLTTFLKEIELAANALLLSLNYSKMAFEPSNKEDQQVIQWYEYHMQRPQAGGAAMGPDCSKVIHKFLTNKEADFTFGESLWDIKGKDQEMLKFLLGFMEEAIGALNLEETEQGLVKRWLAERHQQIAEQKLNLQVHHFDFFVKAF